MGASNSSDLEFIKGYVEANLLSLFTYETLFCQNSIKSIKSCYASQQFIPGDTCQNTEPAILHVPIHMDVYFL